VSQPGPLIQNISDTARWAALYRARESERPDAVFRDPLARRLAGQRGEEIAAAIPLSHHTWTWTTRTYLFDRFIAGQIEQGVDLVVNLAAGLDARPYRMPLPSALRWVEVDLPELIDYKEDILKGEKPACALERVRLDLSDAGARRDLFGRLGEGARKALIITEGLVIYWTAEQVASLARHLAAPRGFQRWAVDVASPGLVRMMQRAMGAQLGQGGAVLQFGPEEGPHFYEPHGWKPVEVCGMLKTAAGLKRLSFWMRLLALLPESKGRQGSRPWGGVCLLAKV